MNIRLEKAVVLLKDVRSLMHGERYASVVEKLDEAIALLEEDDSPNNCKKALHIIGEGLKYLPAIKALFDSLNR